MFHKDGLRFKGIQHILDILHESNAVPIDFSLKSPMPKPIPFRIWDAEGRLGKNPSTGIDTRY